MEKIRLFWDNFLRKIGGRRSLFAIFGIALALLIFIAGAAARFCLKGKPAEAPADLKNWKDFSEDRYDFSFRYPAAWAMDFKYDRYAPGLLDISLNNKKKGWRAECAAGFVDLRILVGNVPEEKGPESSDLKSQLFYETEMIKDSGNANLVELSGIEGKSVYKIKSEAPTLSLNGFCPGPLYLIDDDSRRFIYIFAGFGKDATGLQEEAVKQIIASMGNRQN